MARLGTFITRLKLENSSSHSSLLIWCFFPQKIFKIVQRYGTGDYADPIKYLHAIGTKTDIEIGDEEPELEPEETETDVPDSEDEDALFDLD